MRLSPQKTVFLGLILTINIACSSEGPSGVDTGLFNDVFSEDSVEFPPDSPVEEIASDSQTPDSDIDATAPEDLTDAPDIIAPDDFADDDSDAHDADSEDIESDDVVTVDDGPAPCPNGVLDPETGSCVECLKSDDCPPGQFCDSESCREWLCVPDSRFCSQTILFECSDDGGGHRQVKDCDDHDPCTVGDACEVNKCLNVTPRDCDDENPCTTDSCDPDAPDACIHEPSTGTCDDGRACTTGDTCNLGECVPTGVLNCDDSNFCTNDGCVEGMACVHDAIEQACNDSNSCTFDDSCREGLCQGIALDCDDGDPCTHDTCVNACVHSQIPGCGHCVINDDCIDGNECSLDLCVDGHCVFEPRTIPGCCVRDSDCNDEDLCTAKECVGTPFGTCQVTAVAGIGCCVGEIFGPATTKEALQSFALDDPVDGVGWRLVDDSPIGGSAIYYGSADQSGYDNGWANSGAVVSPEFMIPAAAQTRVEFQVWQDVAGLGGFDRFTVELITDDGHAEAWTRPADFASRTTSDVSVDVSAFSGQKVRLAFRFDTIDYVDNDGEGVYIGRIAVLSTCAGMTCNTFSECRSAGRAGECVAGVCDFTKTIKQAWTIGSAGTGNGQFSIPSAVAIAYDGRIAVCDRGNNRIQIFGPDGTFIRAFGSYGTKPGQFKQPRGIAILGTDLYVADNQNHRVQVITLSGVPRFTIGTQGSGPGQFYYPKGIGISRDGSRVWVADTSNHRIEEFSPDGTFIRSFGEYGTSTGQFKSPSCVLEGPGDTIVVCDTQNDRFSVHESDGTFQRFLPSPPLAFDDPYGAVIGPEDRLYTTNSYNHGLVFYDTALNWLDSIGTFGPGDMQFNYPLGLAADKSGTLILVVDSGNSRIVALTR